MRHFAAFTLNLLVAAARASMQENQHWRHGLYDALMQAVMSAVDSLNLAYHAARQNQVLLWVLGHMHCGMRW
jgi:hypothetical protein